MLNQESQTGHKSVSGKSDTLLSLTAHWRRSPETVRPVPCSLQWVCDLQPPILAGFLGQF